MPKIKEWPFSRTGLLRSLLSGVFEKLFLALLDKAVAAVLGEEGAEK